jgi:hypothetical protein
MLQFLKKSAAGFVSRAKVAGGGEDGQPQAAVELI